MRILLVHGISHIEEDPKWKENLAGPMTQALRNIDPSVEPEYQYFEYDGMFDAAPLDGGIYRKALWDLMGSLAWHGVIDLFQRPRGLFDGLENKLRWTLGMVAQWSVDLSLRNDLQQKLAAQIKAFDPELVVSHSMGTLICYDTFTEKELEVDGQKIDGQTLIEGRQFVTFGSQIQNPAVRNIFGGYLRHLDMAEHWYNLYNPRDTVLVKPITLQYPGFQQVLAEFDNHDMMNHAWEKYVLHPAAIEQVWRTVLLPRVAPKSFAGEMSKKQAVKLGFSSTTTALRTPKRRALLIGINEYPDPANRLEGCVNDVFEVSATLQECGFEAEDIRVVLNDRATADGIRERMSWLLEGIDVGDDRVLYYSGHGARIPTYGPEGRIDSYYETLVPYDFDYKPEHCVTDADLLELYSNLPYGSNFAMIFDCCHSGGLVRDGGPRIRGLTPPDDIRHRMMRWDRKVEMWVERPLPPILEDVPHNDKEGFIGISGCVNRIGRSAALRSGTTEVYNKVREAKGTEGPYLPTIITACQDAEFSYEYRHGVVSYGAFTYAFTKQLRNQRRLNKNPSFGDLVSETSTLLKSLGYNQTPDLVAATVVKQSPIPWVDADSVKKSKKRPS